MDNDAVVLGGDPHESWDTTPDLDEERRIIERCAAIEPRLNDAMVLEHRVGLRPARPETRLELETPMEFGSSTATRTPA